MAKELSMELSVIVCPDRSRGIMYNLVWETPVAQQLRLITSLEALSLRRYMVLPQGPPEEQSSSSILILWAAGPGPQLVDELVESRECPCLT